MTETGDGYDGLAELLWTIALVTAYNAYNEAFGYNMTVGEWMHSNNFSDGAPRWLVILEDGKHLAARAMDKRLDDRTDETRKLLAAMGLDPDASLEEAMAAVKALQPKAKAEPKPLGDFMKLAGGHVWVRWFYVSNWSTPMAVRREDIYGQLERWGWTYEDDAIEERTKWETKARYHLDREVQRRAAGAPPAQAPGRRPRVARHRRPRIMRGRPAAQLHRTAGAAAQLRHNATAERQNHGGASCSVKMGATGPLRDLQAGERALDRCRASSVAARRRGAVPEGWRTLAAPVRRPPVGVLWSARPGGWCQRKQLAVDPGGAAGRGGRDDHEAAGDRRARRFRLGCVPWLRRRRPRPLSCARKVNEAPAQLAPGRLCGGFLRGTRPPAPACARLRPPAPACARLRPPAPACARLRA
jgi:hypothetical protein